MVGFHFLIALAVVCSVLAAVEDRCTTIAVGRTAGVDGPMNTHTADCFSCDFRVSKVPARDWDLSGPEARRPLYLYRDAYPATVSSTRGNTWSPANLEGTEEQKKSWGQESIITGYIPQVAHTFGLYEAGYGIVNEHQVTIGESTCASRFWAPPSTAGGKALVDVRELTHIALERSTSARQAIQIMGDIAVQYGFYGADWSGGDNSLGEGGEALTVIDKQESWMFHVLADDTGSSAVWVAQRVPDNHIAVCANQFVIRKVDKSSPDFMFSSNLWDVAERNGLWSAKNGHLDFLHTYGKTRSHPAYATRRVWRVLSLAAPSLSLTPYTDQWGSDYPFSVPVDKPLSVADLIRIQRDHYEGTQFDLTTGVASGPYGDPDRYDTAAQPADNLTMFDIIEGGYDRSISMFRTSYSIVGNARESVPDQLSLVWFSQYAPSSASYLPLYVAADHAPAAFSRGSLFAYSAESAWWNFCAVGNYAGRFYRFAMRDVFSLQEQLFQDTLVGMQAVEETARRILANQDLNSPGSGYSVSGILTTFTDEQARKMNDAWKSLLFSLISKYHDGLELLSPPTADVQFKKLFYPKYWLDATGFWSNKRNRDPDAILFEAGPAAVNIAPLVLTAIVSGSVALLVGLAWGKKMVQGNGGGGSYSLVKRNPEYVPIDL